MKKWFFTKNGEVTGPLSLTSAKEYLVDNHDVYGWHPSFTQWKPVSCISEFIGIVPLPKQQPSISKLISEKFQAKKQRLETILDSIGDAVINNRESLDHFEKQIEDYKSLTQNLNDDVKGAIDNIEKKYHTIERKLNQVKEAIVISEKEIVVAAESFDVAANSNSVFMPSCVQESDETTSPVVLKEDNSTVIETELDDENLAANEEPAEANFKVYRGSRIAV